MTCEFGVLRSGLREANIQLRERELKKRPLLVVRGTSWRVPKCNNCWVSARQEIDSLNKARDLTAKERRPWCSGRTGKSFKFWWYESGG